MRVCVNEQRTVTSNILYSLLLHKTVMRQTLFAVCCALCMISYVSVYLSGPAFVPYLLQVLVGFKVLTAVSMKKDVFWFVAP